MTDSREHVDISVLKREVERLPSVVAAWATREPEDRVAFRAEWHDMVDVLNQLVTAYDSRGLAADDAGTLRSISIALLAMRPLLEQSRLRLPSREALDRIAGAHVA
jgi:hypothetical protein